MSVLTVTICAWPCAKIWMRDCSIHVVSANYKTINNTLIAIAMSLVTVLYTNIADVLTERENHRTETQSKDALIVKLFFVQFINSYASLYYTAFAMHPLEGNCDGYVRCMDDLSYMVAVILIERFAFIFINDYIMPKIVAYKRYRDETEGVDPSAIRSFTPAEYQYIMVDGDERMEIVNRYMDQVTMYGYMVLFVTAFPLGPLIGYVSNVWQIHTYG